MSKSPLTTDMIEIFLDPNKWPHSSIYREKLTTVLLSSMYKLSISKPDVTTDWKNADDCFEHILAICKENWVESKHALIFHDSTNFDWIIRIPGRRLSESFSQSVFQAELLLHQSELLLQASESDTLGSEMHTRFVRVKDKVDSGIRILTAFIDKTLEETLDQIDLGRASAPIESIRMLLAQFQLCNAEVHRRLAQQEATEILFSDAVKLYIQPCYEALTDVKAFGCLTEEENEKIQAPRSTLYQLCFQTFFDKNSAFFGQLRVESENEKEKNAFGQEYHRWYTLIHPESVTEAPSVHIPVVRRALLDAAISKPVFSGVFDSVLGKNEELQRKPVELTALQLLGSGQTVLLQMNQILDNLTVLRLMHVPGFRTACREGLLALSCFPGVDSPKDYLMKNLMQDPEEFHFSVSDAFDGKNNRRIMYEVLNGTAKLDCFPREIRDEMEFLTESYRLVFDSFLPADLRRYHQDPKKRYPRSDWQVIKNPLCNVVDQRIEQLVQEAKDSNNEKRFTRLESIRKLLENDMFRHLTTRSAYDKIINRMIRENSDQRSVLEDLRFLIRQCYFISNGSLSCDTILLTERDPDFILLDSRDSHIRVEDVGHDDLLEYIWHQAWNPGKEENIGWPDICEIALINRELNIKNKSLELEAQKRAKRAETGLTYQIQGNDVLLKEYTARLSDGDRIHVSPATEDDTEVQNLEMIRRG